MKGENKSPPVDEKAGSVLICPILRHAQDDYKKPPPPRGHSELVEESGVTGFSLKSGQYQKAAQVAQILQILHKWGIHTLGDLRRLDKEELRTRLGPEAVQLWERANGRSIRPLKLTQPPPTYEESFEFEHDVETIEPLLFILRRFLEQISGRLNAIYLVTKELALRLQFANKTKYERAFKIPQPTNDIDLLFRMLHTHLENFKADYPISVVSLEARPVKPARQQFGLFETALRDPNQFAETLARLTGLLGAERVGTPVLEETHRPDAFRMEAFSWQVGAITLPASAFRVKPASRLPHGGRIDLNRPLPSVQSIPVALRRFRPGVTASRKREKNRSDRLESREVSGTISDSKGPYLASGNWWDEKHWERAEWDVELVNGELLRCHQNADGWQIDGIYD